MDRSRLHSRSYARSSRPDLPHFGRPFFNAANKPGNRLSRYPSLPLMPAAGQWSSTYAYERATTRSDGTPLKMADHARRGKRRIRITTDLARVLAAGKDNLAAVDQAANFLRKMELGAPPFEDTG